MPSALLSMHRTYVALEDKLPIALNVVENAEMRTGVENPFAIQSAEVDNRHLSVQAK